MKHFGNSLSYEEILEDIKINTAHPVYYGERINTVQKGSYKNGVFVPSEKIQEKESFKIFHNGKKWVLSSHDDSGNFATPEQAKVRARIVFGTGIKWTKSSPFGESNK